MHVSAAAVVVVVVVVVLAVVLAVVVGIDREIHPVDRGAGKIAGLSVTVTDSTILATTTTTTTTTTTQPLSQHRRQTPVPRMWLLLLGVTSGLLLAPTWSSTPPAVSARSCTYAGVFQAERSGRYTVSFDAAPELCENLTSTLATLTRLRDAYSIGMETCRFGWVSNQSVAILRHSRHEHCAQNNTGFILNVANAKFYDVYCYDETGGYFLRYPADGSDAITPGLLVDSLSLAYSVDTVLGSLGAGVVSSGWSTTSVSLAP
ncbi:hypothetical protein CRUP_014074, partial [Coryphaenoides rupestris]